MLQMRRIRTLDNLAVMSIQILLEVIAKELNLCGSVPFYSCNELFGSTWLASHVIFVEIEPCNERISNELLLIHALSRNSASDVNLSDWISGCFLVPGNQNSLKSLISHALSDIDEGAREDHKMGNSLLKIVLEGLDERHATDINHLSNEAEVVTSTGGHKYGPSYRVLWRNSGKFYFLEIHNES